MSPVSLIATLLEFYSWLIIIYVILSWFPADGFVGEIRSVLSGIVEPYLGIFRRIIPPIGMMDISPIAAILVINLLIGVITAVGR